MLTKVEADQYVERHGVNLVLDTLRNTNGWLSESRFGNQALIDLADAQADITEALSRHFQKIALRLRAEMRMWSGIPHGKRESGDAEGYTYWWVFPTSWTNDQIIDKLASNGVNVTGHYGGPGCWFCREPNIFRKGSRVLVTQYVGLDI